MRFTNEIQLLFDLLVITSLVHFSGGIHSWFWTMYLLVTLEATFLSVAAGTFVYVATFDILRDEFPAPGGRLAKWMVLSLGVLSMSLLAIWT